MSTVQLSVCTLGTTIARPPQHARRSACRSLFGPVDHDEVNRDIEAKLRESSERDQKRWNFNFVSDTPLHGDYEWERAAADTTPAFYQETVRVGKTRAALALHAKPRAQAPDCENTARDDARSLTRMSCTRTPKRSKTSPRLTSSRITDFYMKRRKQRGGRGNGGGGGGGCVKRRQGASLSPFSSLSSEQTPRKRLR